MGCLERSARAVQQSVWTEQSPVVYAIVGQSSVVFTNHHSKIVANVVSSESPPECPQVSCCLLYVVLVSKVVSTAVTEAPVLHSFWQICLTAAHHDVVAQWLGWDAGKLESSILLQCPSTHGSGAFHVVQLWSMQQIFLSQGTVAARSIVGVALKH